MSDCRVTSNLDQTRTTDILAALRDRNHAGHLNIAAANEIEKLRKALGCVSRMKVFPDPQVNMVTLTAAISLAEKALSQ